MTRSRVRTACDRLSRDPQSVMAEPWALAPYSLASRLFEQGYIAYTRRGSRIFRIRTRVWRVGEMFAGGGSPIGGRISVISETQARGARA